MIIRTGFVSNSSSSSFIIAYSSESITVECPCCHRKGLDFKRYFSNGEYYSGEQTEITCSNRDEVIKVYQDDIDYYEERIQEYSYYPKDHIVPYTRGWSKSHTYGEAITSCQEMISDLKADIDVINDVPLDMEVIKLRVSYHDDVAMDMLKSEYDNGTLKIIYDSEGRICKEVSDD